MQFETHSLRLRASFDWVLFAGVDQSVGGSTGLWHFLIGGQFGELSDNLDAKIFQYYIRYKIQWLIMLLSNFHPMEVSLGKKIELTKNT